MCHASFSVPTLAGVTCFSDEYLSPGRLPMLDNQLSPAGAFICSAVKAGAGVMVVLAGAADETPAPVNTTTAKHENKKTSETRRMQLPPEIATGSNKTADGCFHNTSGRP